MSELIARLEEADAAYQRALDSADTLSPNGCAIAGAMVLALHGRLFAECAAVLRAKD